MSAGVPDLCEAIGHDLGWGLGVLLREVLRQANEVAADVPGGQRGYQVLVAVATGEVPTQSVLAHQLGMDRSVITNVLDDLESRNLIVRRPDPHDRRAWRPAITAVGRQQLAVLPARMAEVYENVLAALPAPQRAAFCSQVQAAADHLAARAPRRPTRSRG